jgi:hypothetical protein
MQPDTGRALVRKTRGKWLLLILLTGAAVAEEDPRQLPPRRISEGEEFKLDLYGLKRPAVYSLTDEGERNTAVLEVHPDGYVRMVRIFGIVRFEVPLRGEALSFSLTTGQRAGAWSMSRLEAAVRKGVLSVRMVPPAWAAALEVEFGGLTGVTVKYRGREGVLLTGQRMDSLLGPEGELLLARSGKGLKPELPVPEERRMPGPPRVRDLEQPGAYKPPKGWHRRADWTSLPLLPTVVEPARPPIVTP